MIREQIMALDKEFAYDKPFRNGFDEAKSKSAKLAEARELELLDAMGLLEGIADNFKAERSKMIAGLRKVERFSVVPCNNDTYGMGISDTGDWVDIDDIKAIINKYEAMK